MWLTTRKDLCKEFEIYLSSKVSKKKFIDNGWHWQKAYAINAGSTKTCKAEDDFFVLKECLGPHLMVKETNPYSGHLTCDCRQIRAKWEQVESDHRRLTTPMSKRVIWRSKRELQVSQTRGSRVEINCRMPVHVFSYASFMTGSDNKSKLLQ